MCKLGHLLGKFLVGGAFLCYFCLSGPLFAQEQEPLSSSTREAEVQRRQPNTEKRNKALNRLYHPNSKVSLDLDFDKIIEDSKRRSSKIAASRKRSRKLAKKRPKHIYFGHKRKPKRRKASKRRFCKECGIVH